MFHRDLAGVVLLAALLSAKQVTAADDECGDVSIASMAWASAELIAEIDKAILSAGYGCNVELVSGDTVPTFKSMSERGEPDIAPELWVDIVGEPLDAALAQGRVVKAAQVLADGGEEGWWIPKYIAEAHPDINTAADALKRPELFAASEDELRGAMHNCPASWHCHVINANLFRAYGSQAAHFDLIDTESAAGLDGSIARAYTRQEGWLGYYWAPSALLGRYEMVKLDMGEHNAEHWNSCTAAEDCEDPQPNGWAGRKVFSIVSRGFAAKAGAAMDYLLRRSWNNSTVNTMLAWMADNQATGEEAARHFLESHEAIWSTWVPARARAQVKASLHGG